MDTDIQAKVAERLAELPPEVQNAIHSAEWEHHLRDIGQKHALHIDQMGTLEDETLLVMLGFADAGEFAAHIAGRLGVSAETASTIAGEINTAVFLPIRESMKRFIEAKAAAPTPTPPSPAAVAPTPTPIPATPATTPAPPPPSKPVDVATETILATPTASVAPTAPTVDEKPIVKTDPYREPVE